MFKKLAKKHGDDVIQILNNIDVSSIDDISCIFESNEYDPVSKGYVDSFSVLLFQGDVVSAIRLSSQLGKVHLALIDDTENSEYLELLVDKDQVDQMFLSISYFAKLVRTSFLQDVLAVDMSCFMDVLTKNEIENSLKEGMLGFESKLGTMKKENSLEHNEQVFTVGSEGMSYIYSSDKIGLEANTLELYTEFDAESTIDPMYVAAWITDKNNEDSENDILEELEPLVFTSKNNMEIYFAKYLDECFIEWRRKMNNAYKNSLI